MKKIIFILFVVLFVNHTYSQISTAKKLDESVIMGIADKMVGLPKLAYSEIDKNTKQYYLYYYNLEYPTIKDIQTISFTATSDELEYFYKFLQSGFDSTDKQSLKIGDASIIIYKTYSSIKVSVTQKNDIPGWFYLSKKQIDKLFGKK